MSTKQSSKATIKSDMPKVLVLADLNKAIDGLIKQVASVQVAIQTVGVQALMHLKAHGDNGPVNRLFIGLGKGVRKQALGSWLIAHGALEVNTAADTRKTMPLKYTKAKQTDPEAAMQDPWYEHLPEKDISDIFDLQKAIHGILQRAQGKTIQLHGKTMSVDHAADTLKALAAMAGEEGYKPDVKQLAPDTPAEAAAKVKAEKAAAKA